MAMNGLKAIAEGSNRAALNMKSTSTKRCAPGINSA
jgi:hypothetical protein